MTTVAFGPEQLRLVLNGHTVEGWADTADFFMPPQDATFYRSKTGPTGDKYFYRSGSSRGGQLKVVLFPGTASSTFFDQQAEVVARGGDVEWSGTADWTGIGQNGEQIRRSQTYERGRLMTAPKGDQFGQEELGNKTYIFEFEDIG